MKSVFLILFLFFRTWLFTNSCNVHELILCAIKKWNKEEEDICMENEVQRIKRRAAKIKKRVRLSN